MPFYGLALLGFSIALAIGVLVLGSLGTSSLAISVGITRYGEDTILQAYASMLNNSTANFISSMSPITHVAAYCKGICIVENRYATLYKFK